MIREFFPNEAEADLSPQNIAACGDRFLANRQQWKVSRADFEEIARGYIRDWKIWNQAILKMRVDAFLKQRDIS